MSVKNLRRAMNSFEITNSLLRLDEMEGEAPFPFERPNQHMNFIVLELGQHKTMSSWCAHTEEILIRHRELLRKLRAAGAKASLFVECDASVKVLRIEAAFLVLLSEAEIALECSYVGGYLAPQRTAGTAC
jgi:hypothetical protein